MQEGFRCRNRPPSPKKLPFAAPERAGRSWRCSICWGGAGRLRIIWELRDGPLTSRALRTACDEASPTVMQARLSELREAGLVELRAGDGYRLTALGRELMESFLPLHRFAERWSRQMAG